jgi:hypothetical protein
MAPLFKDIFDLRAATTLMLVEVLDIDGVPEDNRNLHWGQIVA